MTLAIISTNKEAYSETFIHNHVKLLPATVHFLFDGYLPQQYSCDKGFTSRFFSEDAKPKWYTLKKTNEKESLLGAIESYLLQNNVDLILCEYGPCGVEMLPVAQKLNIPLVVHFHGFDAYRHDVLQAYGKQYKYLFLYAAAVIAVSAHMRRQLIALDCPGQKLHTLYYGIDTALFKYKNLENLSPVFVSCGRFVEKKAPQLTLKAFEIVLQKIPEARLIMIGDGELLADCKALAQTRLISESVEFTGALNQAQIAERFESALVFVQHSVTTPDNDSEGTPLAILEAMASGLPVISTHHGGIGDVVQENINGYLVNEQDVEAMAEKMLRLALHPDRAKAMGKKASQHVHEKYRLEVYTQQVFEILKQAKNQ